LKQDADADISKIDTLTLAWAVHSLSGIVSPANASYSAEELTHQLKDSGSKILFTCVPLLPVALEAAANAGIPKSRVYLLRCAPQMLAGLKVPKEYKFLDQLVKEGEKEPRLEKFKWTKGQGARQVAFLCYSSGTSGLPVRSVCGGGA
jgi:acyl-CoA synthetase (AMP-forming)/AMP-acid ligase II